MPSVITYSNDEIFAIYSFIQSKPCPLCDANLPKPNTNNPKNCTVICHCSQYIAHWAFMYSRIVDVIQFNNFIYSSYFTTIQDFEIFFPSYISVLNPFMSVLNPFMSVLNPLHCQRIDADTKSFRQNLIRKYKHLKAFT